LLVGTGFERSKDLAASSREAQKALPAVGGGALAANQAAAFEVGENAAQVSGIEAQFPPQVASGGFVAMREFVEDADFSEGKGAVEKAVLQNTNLAGVKAVEAPNFADCRGEYFRGHLNVPPNI
jgi:hypothetical protein